MKSIDRVRKQANGDDCIARSDKKSLNAWFDEVEHECNKAIVEAHARGFEDCRLGLGEMDDEELAELGLIRLPKDADGEYINIGDVMAYEDNTKPLEVLALVPPAVFLTENGPRFADMCRHYHATTVEDVLREMLGSYDVKRGYTCGHQTPQNEIIAEYAKRLQLREEE